MWVQLDVAFGRSLANTISLIGRNTPSVSMKELWCSDKCINDDRMRSHEFVVKVTKAETRRSNLTRDSSHPFSEIDVSFRAFDDPRVSKQLSRIGPLRRISDKAGNKNNCLVDRKKN